MPNLSSIELLSSAFRKMYKKEAIMTILEIPYLMLSWEWDTGIRSMRMNDDTWFLCSGALIPSEQMLLPAPKIKLSQLVRPSTVSWLNVNCDTFNSYLNLFCML